MGATFPEGGTAHGVVPRFATHTGGSVCGRGGMGQAFAEKLYRDYLLLGSVAKVAAKHGRTRQSVWDTLHRRGYQLKPLKRQPAENVVIHEGEKFTPDKNGFLRSTTVRRAGHGVPAYLHHRIWIAARGPIPAGHEVVFVNENKRDVRLENLKLSKIGKRCAELGRGANGWTSGQRSREMTARLLERSQRGTKEKDLLDEING